MTTTTIIRVTYLARSASDATRGDRPGQAQHAGTEAVVRNSAHADPDNGTGRCDRMPCGQHAVFNAGLDQSVPLVSELSVRSLEGLANDLALVLKLGPPDSASMIGKFYGVLLVLYC